MHMPTACCGVCVCAAGGNRYLSSDISYFGVGSKNAAFYLGKTVKVVSKTSDSSYVHELCIQGEAQQLCRQMVQSVPTVDAVASSNDWKCCCWQRLMKGVLQKHLRVTPEVKGSCR